MKPISFSKRVPVVSGTIVLSIGISVVTGWLTGVDRWTSVLPHSDPMASSTAIAVFSLSAAILLKRGSIQASALIFALIGTFLGTLGLARAFTGDPFGIGTLEVAIQNREWHMSMYTSAHVFLIGLAVLLIDVELKFKNFRPSQLLTVLTFIIPAQRILAHIYGLSGEVESVNRNSTMAPVTAVSFLLLSISVLFLRPNHGVMVVFNSETPAGQFVRRLMIPGIIVPLLLGWFIAEGAVHNLYHSSFGASILVLIGVIVFLTSLWKNGKQVHELHRNLDTALKDLSLAKIAAEEANRAKNEFVANMSHEIRSPVGVMIGFTDLLIDPNCPPEEKEHYRQVIKRNGQALLSIINDILDLSKIEADKLIIDMSPINIIDLVRDIAVVHNPLAQQKGIQLNVKWDGLAPKFIISDPIRLRQILTNLVSNAIKFTTSGEVNLTVRCMLCDLEHRRFKMCFEVTDTGPGISPEHSKRLFKPFEQGDASSTRQFGGSGLGLAISKRLAAALSGELVLKSTILGQGSTFELTINGELPINTIEESPISLYDLDSETNALKTMRSSPKLRLNSLRVLLAEDAPDNRLLLKRILELEGAHVDFAVNGGEAVDKALSNFYDVVLMDIQMPQVDGLEATSHLRNIGYSKPIIALTAHAMKEDQEKSRAAGMNDHISKPVHREVLVHTLQRYFPAPAAGTKRA